MYRTYGLCVRLREARTGTGGGGGKDRPDRGCQVSESEPEGQGQGFGGRGRFPRSLLRVPAWRLGSPGVRTALVR